MMTDTWQYRVPQDPAGDLPDEWVWERLRLRRDALLTASDSRVGPDAPGDVDTWRTYRQALRDLPQVTTDPRQAVWPDPPTSTTRNPNRATIETQARNALTTNRAFIDRGTSNTAAQVRDQTIALSRQVNALIRLELGDLTGTD
jgi:hypothetical protein